MKKIRFIINPISGVWGKHNIAARIEDTLDHNKYIHDVVFTQAAGHATELAEQAVAEGCHVVVAVGGDGSVNEVATGLIGTKATLGILPMGSGNGYATHLGIKRAIKSAIKVLNTGKIRTLDTCTVNDRPFINLAGLGFDGLVSYRLKTSSIRGFWGYFSFAIQDAFWYKSQRYKLFLDGIEITRDCFVIEIANAPMFGYGMNIVPEAVPDDGFMDVLIINKRHKLKYISSFWRFPMNSVQDASFVESYRVKEVDIEISKGTPMHVDGEGFLQRNNMKFRIKPLSLNVIVP